MRTTNLAVVNSYTDAPWESGWKGLNDAVILNPNGPVSFQWTDFNETCQLNQARLHSDVVFKAEYDQKVSELEKLKAMPVWLRAHSKVYQTSLYDLYCDAIFQRHFCGVENHAPCDVSFISPSGPYKEFTVSDCFNAQTYQDFVQMFLLQGKLPQRDFRLRVPSRLLVEYGHGFSEAALIDLQQITAKGLLFKCPSALFFNQMRPHMHVRLLIKTSALSEANRSSDWDGFQEAVGIWNTNPFYTQNKQEAFMLSCNDFQVASRFDFGQTQDAYLFVTHTSLLTSNELMAQQFEHFIQTGRSHIQRLIKASAA